MSETTLTAGREMDALPDVRPVYVVIVPGEDGATTHRIRQGLSALADNHYAARAASLNNAANPQCPEPTRAQELATAAYHTEELHIVGEMVARFGGRNAYPRPAAPAPHA